MDKREFRKNALALRDWIKDREKKSQKICEQLLSLPQFADCKTVMCYVSFRSEVQTEKIITAALSAGKRVCVPFVENGQMYASAINSPEEMTPGTYGILEPVNKRQVEGSDIDVCLVPGAAFDKEGFRTGYGGGYYDRFLPDTQALRIGLCFDEQIFDAVPKDEHDVKMDMLITEKGVLYAR